MTTNWERTKKARQRQANRKYHNAHREERREKSRRYKARNRERIRLERRVNNPDGSVNWKAKNEFDCYNAVRRGKLPHPTSQVCADCGATAAEWHHPEYGPDKALEVEALCVKCHHLRHGNA